MTLPSISAFPSPLCPQRYPPFLPLSKMLFWLMRVSLFIRTLAGRIPGKGRDFAGYSSQWSSTATIAAESAHQLDVDSTMKNAAWTNLPQNALLVCFKGSQTGCQTFTHNKGQSLSQLFAGGIVNTVESETPCAWLVAFSCCPLSWPLSTHPILRIVSPLPCKV